MTLAKPLGSGPSHRGALRRPGPAGRLEAAAAPIRWSRPELRQVRSAAWEVPYRTGRHPGLPMRAFQQQGMNRLWGRRRLPLSDPVAHC
jgi:hypothetical protein